MYVLEYQDDEGNNYREEEGWTWEEAQHAMKELKEAGFSNFALNYVGE